MKHIVNIEKGKAVSYIREKDIKEEIGKWLSVYCRNNACEFCYINYEKLKELINSLGEKKC